MPIRTAVRGFRAAVRGWLHTFRREPWLAEFWSAWAAIGWAVISINSHEELSARQSYILMVRVADTQTWEMLGLALGLCQLAALIYDERMWRWGVAVVLSWWWSLLSVGIYMVDKDAPGLALFVSYAGINIFSLFRLLKHYP
jgi:hypothetical protein